MNRLDRDSDRDECPAALDPREVQLLMQAQMHDLSGFREIVEQLKNKVFSVSYALLGDAVEAEVAAQEAFVRLYHTAVPFARQHDVMKYAYRFVVDQCLVEVRKRQLRRIFSFSWFTGPRALIDSKRLPGKNENPDVILVRRALSMISYNERVLLVLKEVADQTIAEIADIVQLDSTVIRLRLFAARQKFGWAAAELSRWQHLRCI